MSALQPPLPTDPAELEGTANHAAVVLRSLAFNLAFYAHLAVTLVVATPLLLVLPRKTCLAIARGWAVRSLWLLKAICRTRVEFRGVEHLPAGAFLLAEKHQSMWETFALFAVVKEPAHVMKRELAYVPLWNVWAWRTGMVFVSRGKRGLALKQMSDGARRAIGEGRPVVVAPEGRRRPPGAAPAYKYGIAHLYAELDVPVVPAALNSGLYWPKYSFLRYPGTIVMAFLPPIAPGLAPDAFLLQRLETDIEAECDRLLVEAAAASPRPPFRPEAAERLAALGYASRRA